MNFEKVDKILLSTKDMYLINKWWMEIHQGASNEFRPVLEEGVIVLELNENELEEADKRDRKTVSKDTRLYFKQINQHVVYYEIYRTSIQENKLVFVLSAHKNYQELKSNLEINPQNGVSVNEKNAIAFLDSLSNLHVALMNYMELYKEERVSVQKIRKIGSKKTKQGKKKNVRPITSILYKLTMPNKEVTDEEKRAYNKMKESWGVKGHWRQCKNGKMVWVRPYIKGNQSKKEETIYKLY